MWLSTLDLTTPQGAHIAERLRGDLIVWLATVRPDGRPHLAAVWFLWDGETILIFSQPNQKVRNLRANPHVVLSLDDTGTGDDAVTIEGIAELLAPGTVTSELAPYAEKYAAKLREMGWTPHSMAQSYTEAIRITPARFHIV
ncbi:MAG TPA: TIGR03667 family PPOX class F420-dependent oxidoreductase [Ktedonobacterales bacterium]